MKKTFFTNTPLLISLLISMAVASTEAPLWISVFCFVMLLWKYLNEKERIKKIPKRFTPLIGFLLFAVIYSHYKTILGQEESTTALLGLISIVILNYETERDTLFLVLLGFLVLMIKSIFSLDFIWILPALISFFGLWFALISNEKINKFRYLLKATVCSLPILVALFILFPRLVIFQTAKANKAIAQSGFSEELNPGSFSEIALQNQLVFRVEFSENQRLKTNDLYWRGAVLDVSNGFIWQKSIQKDSAQNIAKRTSKTKVENLNSKNKKIINYKVILEPQKLKNIFVLESPDRIIRSTALFSELPQSLFSIDQVTTKQIQFEATAIFNEHPISNDERLEIDKYLVVPELPQKTKEWVESVIEKNLSAEERLKELISFFSNSGFIYTLKPELYKNNLDLFLFERRKGFCEHFAAAFGTLSRALKIPARIILGYQGGLYNSAGQFWKISQKDAHAWVEVLMNDHWKKIDPTAFVSPLRISMGGENYFALSDEEQRLYAKSSSWKKKSSIQDYIDQMSASMDYLNYRWTVMLLNYDLDLQLDVLNKLRGPWAIYIFYVLIFLFSINFLKKYIHKKTTLRKKHSLYTLFSEIEKWADLQPQKIDKNVSMAPLEILKKISQQHKHTKKFIDRFSADYERITYQNISVVDINPAALRSEWRKLSKNKF